VAVPDGPLSAQNLLKTAIYADEQTGPYSGQQAGFVSGLDEAVGASEYNRENHGGSGRTLGLKTTERDRRFGEPSLHRNVWSQQVPIIARALVLADKTLCLAGPPEPADLRTSELALRNPDRAEASFRGQQGAALCLVDATDGKLLAQYELESSPVFDGMIAARNRIFLSLENGSLVCFGE